MYRSDIISFKSRPAALPGAVGIVCAPGVLSGLDRIPPRLIYTLWGYTKDGMGLPSSPHARRAPGRQGD
jgi:hypothetical protein